MKEGDEIPPQVVGDVLEWLAKRHLEKKEPFPVDEWLDPLLEMFLALADYARTKTKPDAPGVRAAYGADFLTFLGMSKGRARKLAAENSKVKVTSTLWNRLTNGCAQAEARDEEATRGTGRHMICPLPGSG